MRQILLTVSLIPAVIITPRQDTFKLPLCLVFLVLVIYLFFGTWTVRFTLHVNFTLI